MKFKETRIPTKDLAKIYHYIRREDAAHDVISTNILGSDHLAEFSRVTALRSGCPTALLHWVLAFPEQDTGKLTPELITKVWKRFFHHLELPQTCKYVIATHGADRQHSHALISRIGTDASVYLGRFSVRKGIKATEKMEREFGLTVTATLDYENPATRMRTTLTKHEYDQAKRTNAPVRKDVVAAIIDYAIHSSRGSLPLFMGRCEECGLVSNVIERSNGAKGITFTYDGVSFKGSAIAKGYSYNGIARALEQQQEAESQPAAMPRRSQVVPHKVLNELKAGSTLHVLPQQATAEQKTEAEGHKRSLIERLDKLRRDCADELVYPVTLLFYVIGARLYVPEFYFTLRAQVRNLEELSRQLKSEKAERVQEIERGLVTKPREVNRPIFPVR